MQIESIATVVRFKEQQYFCSQLFKALPHPAICNPKFQGKATFSAMYDTSLKTPEADEIW
jgi:hypothetical protein